MKVLVARAGALGDVLLLRTLVASLRRAGAHVTLLAPSGPGSILIGPGSEEAQALVPWEGIPASGLFAEEPDGPALRSPLGTYDVALCLSRSRELPIGLKEIASRVIAHDPQPAGRHAALHFALPLQQLGIPQVAPGCLAATAGERDAVRPFHHRLPRGFVAIHPGSGSARKNWPAASFINLARRLSVGAPWLLCLGPAEPPTLAAPEAVVACELPPRHLGALMASAGIYMGNDSGATHLAAAYGAPTVALFGPTDPAVWAPVGPRVSVLRAADEDMESISVDAVAAAAEALR